MSPTILDRIKDVTDAWVKLDEKIGFTRIVKYLILALVIFFLFNIKKFTKEAIRFVQEVSEQIHNENMIKRDNLMEDLTPILQEFRTEIKADRLLYFEYHNSKENLVGIPFKYIDLVQQSTKYGVPAASIESYRDINVGIITDLYNELKIVPMILCSGESDHTFLRKYPGTFELFNEIDRSKKLIFLSIPGIRQPIGMIVLEWVTEPEATAEEVSEIIEANERYIAVINGLILANR